MTRTITLQFRWSVKQTAEREIQVIIPTVPDGTTLLNPEFIKDYKLSGAEISACEELVLREVAVVK